MLYNNFCDTLTIIENTKDESITISIITGIMLIVSIVSLIMFFILV